MLFKMEENSTRSAKVILTSNLSPEEKKSSLESQISGLLGQFEKIQRGFNPELWGNGAEHIKDTIQNNVSLLRAQLKYLATNFYEDIKNQGSIEARKRLMTLVDTYCRATATLETRKRTIPPSLLEPEHLEPGYSVAV